MTLIFIYKTYAYVERSQGKNRKSIHNMTPYNERVTIIFL